jgi:hypothetical protein
MNLNHGLFSFSFGQDNLSRCGISPRNKRAKEFQIGQHFSKTVGEADASLIDSRRWNNYAYFTKIAPAS